MRCLIIIPAYNEAENIEKVISNIIKNYPQYDYIIVNDGLEEAVEDFRSIVRAESFRAEFARELINEVMKNA